MDPRKASIQVTPARESGDAALGRDRQWRGARDDVDRGRPDRLARHLDRIREVQEGAAGQRGVHEVLPGAPKHFLGDHDAKRDAQGDLPKRRRRRQRQRIENRRDEEAFVDLVVADCRKEHLPMPPAPASSVDRHEVDQAVEVRPDADGSWPIPTRHHAPRHPGERGQLLSARFAW